MTASRWMGGEKPDAPRREFELAQLINSLLRTIFQVEVTLVLVGIHFPVGGSRVVVAKKPMA
jgi:hypothetical protein